MQYDVFSTELPKVIQYLKDWKWWVNQEVGRQKKLVKDNTPPEQLNKMTSKMKDKNVHGVRDTTRVNASS